MKSHVKLIALAGLGICIALGASIKTDYDHAANFGGYHTYSWGKVDAGDSLWADRISRAIDEQMAAKGLTKVASGGDLTVSAFGATHNQQSVETFYTGFGGGWRWRGFGDATTDVLNTPVGTLLVDVFDSQSKHLVWRGNSSESLSEKPDKNEKKLEHDVADMFKKFPPK
jgi:hypothetical protein